MDPHPASQRKYKIIGFDPSPYLIYLSSARILMSYRSYRHICLVLPCCEFQTTCWTQEPLHRLKPGQAVDQSQPEVSSAIFAQKISKSHLANIQRNVDPETVDMAVAQVTAFCNLLKHQSAGLHQTLALRVQFLHCQVACFGVEHVSATGSLASPANSSMKIKGLNWQ